MSSLIGVMASMNVLLMLLSILLWFGKRKFSWMSYSSLLRVGYVSILAAILLPIFMAMGPGKDPFGPVVRVWQETENSESGLSLASSVQVKVPQFSGESQRRVGFSSAVATAFLFLILAFVFWRLVSLLYGFVELNKLLQNSYLLRSIGKTKVWVTDQVVTPFSFYNGCAHVVIPESVLMDRVGFRISLRHEIQHHRQGDTFWIYFIELVRLFFCINPFVHWLVVQIQELQELACDEALVGHKCLSREEYGDCLLGFAEKQLLKQKKPIGAIGIIAETYFLKRRVEIMFEKKRVNSKLVLNSFLLATLLLATGTAWALRGVVGSQTISLEQARYLAGKISSKQKIPVNVDTEVLYWLNRAIGSEATRKVTRESLKRMKSYKSMIVSKFEQSDLPAELIAVPLIESGFNNSSVSSMKAAGIWQFMPQTARLCGLKVNNDKDERFQANRLTDAATCYYKKLHAIFQNWHVVIAAYNLGESRMMKAISDSGHNDVFRLAREGKLGKEGKSYGAKVMAGMIIVNNPSLVE